MTQNVPLNTGDPAVEAFFDATQEMLSGLSANFVLELVNPTTIRVPAGAGHNQVSISIEGQYRYVTAPVTRAFPPGGAGAYDIYATAVENDPVSFAPPGNDYSFALAIVPAAATPVGVDIFRLVGHLTWDGAAITRLVQDIGAPDPRVVNAVQGAELLRAVRGAVNTDGSIVHGAGFAAARTGVGLYTVTFTTAFAGSPTVDLTPISAGDATGCVSAYTDGSFQARLRVAGALADVAFGFIAEGPR